MANIAQNTFLNWLALEEVNRQAQVRTYRSYYDGDPPSVMTDRQAEYLNLSRDKSVSVNVCAVVVDALSERLEVTGFTVSPKDAEAQQGDEQIKQLGQLLDGWWQDNRMDGVQGWVHTAAARDAEAFVVVEYDEDEKRPYLCHDYAYDGTSGVKVHMKPGTYNKVAFASKRWQEQDSLGQTTNRLNLYFPNRIEKWISKAPGSDGHSEAFWQPYEALGTTIVTLKDDASQSYQAAVAWWTEDGTASGKPLGVPVISFVNKDDGTGRGMSELDNALPIQDAINKTFLDLMAAADMTGWQMYFNTGKQPSGGWKVYPGAMLNIVPHNDTQAAAVGVIPAGDLSQLISLWQSLIAVLSGITGTPQSRFSPAAIQPSEGTQQQEEGALIAKVKDRQKTWGNGWEDVMKMALKVARAFGEGKIPDISGLVISTAWADAIPRNETNHLNALAVKADKLGVPLEQLWSEAGYTAAQIRKFKADAARRQAAQRLADAKAKAAQPPAPPPVPPPPPAPPGNGNGGSPPATPPTAGTGPPSGGEKAKVEPTMMKPGGGK
jgi:hypothetical protein